MFQLFTKKMHCNFVNFVTMACSGLVIALTVLFVFTASNGPDSCPGEPIEDRDGMCFVLQNVTLFFLYGYFGYFYFSKLRCGEACGAFTSVGSVMLLGVIYMSSVAVKYDRMEVNPYCE